MKKKKRRKKNQERLKARFEQRSRILILQKIISGGRKEKSEGENAGHSRYCSIDPGAIKRERK